jgi:hypothetical protein
MNRCRQRPDRIAPRGHPVFAEWCPSAAACCSLRSELRSGDGSRPCARMIKMDFLDPQKQAILISLRQLRRDAASQCAAGARLSSALSSPLSSAPAGGLALLPRSDVPADQRQRRRTNPLHVVGGSCLCRRPERIRSWDRRARIPFKGEPRSRRTQCPVPLRAECAES